MKTIHRPSAFTLIELLVVITILGIVAALTVPALKNIGKSNSQTSAARQLMDDIGRARQYAINNHSSVYMVFVPTNFANDTFIAGFNSTAMPNTNDLRVALTTLTNLVAGQLTAYNFVSYGKLGDQPGNHAYHYLDPWKYLPAGTMIHKGKYTIAPGGNVTYGPQQWTVDYNHPPNTVIPGFNRTAIPFPTDSSPAAFMPTIMFNYLGQAINGTTAQDEYIMLAQGYVSYPLNPLNPTTKIPALNTVPLTDSAIVEVPPGNSTDISYNIVHVTGLTGRVGLEYFSVK